MHATNSVLHLTGTWIVALWPLNHSCTKSTKRLPESATILRSGQNILMARVALSFACFHFKWFTALIMKSSKSSQLPTTNGVPAIGTKEWAQSNKGINLTAYSKLFVHCCAIVVLKKLAAICKLSQRYVSLKAVRKSKCFSNGRKSRSECSSGSLFSIQNVAIIMSVVLRIVIPFRRSAR